MTDEPKLPYMPVFAGDWLAEAADLDAAERGALWSLILGCWDRGGSLSADPQRLARLAGADPASWREVWSAISKHFTVKDGRLTHSVVTVEIERARRERDARRRAAEETNAKRAAKRDAQRDGDRNGQRDGQRTSSDTRIETLSGTPPSPSPSPSPSGSPEPTGGGSAPAPRPGSQELEAFRQARARAIAAANGKQVISTAEPAKDRRAFLSKVAELPSARRALIGAAAVLYFRKEGQDAGDTYWRTNRWKLHLFTTQGLDILLDEAEATQRRREHQRAAHQAEQEAERVRQEEQAKEEARVRAAYPLSTALRDQDPDGWQRLAPKGVFHPTEKHAAIERRLSEQNGHAEHRAVAGGPS